MRVKVCYCVSAVEMSSVGAARLGATIKERVRSDAKTEVEMCMTQRSQLTCASKIFLSRFAMLESNFENIVEVPWFVIQPSPLSLPAICLRIAVTILYNDISKNTVAQCPSLCLYAALKMYTLRSPEITWPRKGANTISEDCKQGLCPWSCRARSTDNSSRSMMFVQEQSIYYFFSESYCYDLHDEQRQ